MSVEFPIFKRIPKHIALIPDGNRRWAQARGLGKEAGYAFGIQPGLDFVDLCIAVGVEEVTAYGFTNDNTRRPAEQRAAFQQACVHAVEAFIGREASLRVVGNTESPMFPPELLPYTKERVTFGRGLIRANFLVNYDWHWDLSQALRAEGRGTSRKSFMELIGSADVSRIDLLMRWGGRRRLSGLLPVQSVYTDFYVIDDLWPDFTPEQFYAGLRWYEAQDVTLGG